LPQTSDIDPLEFFLSEADLRNQVRDESDPEQSAPSTKIPSPVNPSAERSRPPPSWGRSERVVALGCLTTAVVLSVTWLATGPAKTADGPTFVELPAERIERRSTSAEPVPTRPESSQGPYVADPEGVDVDMERGAIDLAESRPQAEIMPGHVLQPATLSVEDSGVGTEVVNRELVGRFSRFPSGSDVVFWTLITGGRSGEEVRHVWLRDGEAVSIVSLTVGSPRWRTYSSLRLQPEVEANWVVEARDLSGRVLARREFRSVSSGSVTLTAG
jgi:hypothetical protein